MGKCWEMKSARGGGRAGLERVTGDEFKRAYQHPYLDCGVLLEEGVVNSSPPVIKRGCVCFQMNEQADKLCEGSQRRERERGEQGDTGADTVVFGPADTQSAGGH